MCLYKKEGEAQLRGGSEEKKSQKGKGKGRKKKGPAERKKRKSLRESKGNEGG
ncbi:hypothetical protein HYC85_030565 [Camellia sinensis]|uniref:Uncharacterized protein n=1 Tax=Camellia sinensis TaxID=4442 RepID=A0A7J7G4Y4_CAMSI|nr:hypothetical protein HYC85_030565 [Camellia sinensis]